MRKSQQMDREDEKARFDAHQKRAKQIALRERLRRAGIETQEMLDSVENDE